MTMGVLKYKTFSLLLVSLSHVMVFYLQLNIVLSKEKLKIQIICMNFTIHLYIVQ